MKMGVFSWFTNNPSNPQQLSYMEKYGYTLNLRVLDESFDNENVLYKNYTLYSMDEEDLDDFYNLTNSIIREIFKDRKILIAVEPMDKMSFQNECYLEFSKKLSENKEERADERMFLDEKQNFMSYCDGKRTPIFMRYAEEEDKYMSLILNVYGVRKETDISSLEQAKTVIKDNTYDIAMNCERYPDKIEFTVGSNIDINYIIEGIKNVCKEKKKTLYIEYPYARE